VPGRRERMAVLVLSAALFLFHGLRFDGPARGYWDTYITVPAMFMTGQPVDLHRIDGTPRFTYELKGRVPDDTYDPSPGSYGIASEDQRIGTAILFAAPFALFGLAAFRWGFAAAWAFTFLFGYLSFRRLLPPSRRAGPVAIAAALVLVLNPFSLYLERLNGNLFGLAGLAFLWWLATDERPRWTLVGLCYGLMGGIRNEAIVVAPLFPVLMWAATRRPVPFLKAFAAFTLAAFLGILPVLFWNDFAYGAAIIHPSQVERLQGFRPTFPHSFLGSSFPFNGLLNWPFADHVIRTPHFAYPTFLLWPLVTAKALGVVLLAAAVLGAGVLLRRRPLHGALLLFWYAIVYGLFMFQENWEELKQTFMALHLFPLAAFLAAGLDWVAEAAGTWRRWAVLGALAAALAGAVWSARLLDVPADDRWYVRFPHAARNESGLAELPESLRKDWQYFYTRETPAEADRERLHLASPSPLPALYRPIHWPDGDTLPRIAAEPFSRDLRTLAIWSYIYE
jgi:hypothetical protein